MNRQTASELRLEPGGLGRHYIAGVGNPYQLVHTYGIESESNCHLAAVHPALELTKSSYAAHEVNPLVCAQILDTEDLVEPRLESTVTSRQPIGSESS